jgi:general L-amino acid transport system permease protein
VGLDDWGGLQLSLLLAASGIILAFPLGILLALGRRSSLAGVRTVSIGFIEFVRGVPLITLLLSANFFLGFFLPVGSDTPSLVGRAIVVITLFSGAYIAEIIRGGLQAVPKGQSEAAQALGLSPLQTSRFVVMPQALRAVLPAMVGQFISLFKDTSLVVIIGLTDLLRFSELANAQPEFVGRELGAITLTFVGFIYWIGSYTMSRESRRLEKKLGVGER